VDDVLFILALFILINIESLSLLQSSGDPRANTTAQGGKGLNSKIEIITN